MPDDLQVAIWGGVLVCGVLVCIALRKAGLAATHVRDLLHVGAGAWVFGWPFWHSAVGPILVTIVATLGVIAIPPLAPRVSLLARFQQSVSDGNERWSGLTLYAVAFTVMTWLAWHSGPFPAAAALLALAIGDGIGGAVGLRFGRHFFKAPGGKRKSLEGSALVALAALLGAWIASLYFESPVSAAVLFGVGFVAAAVEGLAPRASDNVLVPAAVWFFATLCHRPP